MQRVAEKKLKPSFSKEKIDQEIRYLTPLSVEWCDPYFMPDPHDGHYEITDNRHLYVYKNDQDEFFYTTEAGGEKKYLPPWLFEHQEFNSTQENPVTDNHELIKAILDITSKRGDTLQITRNDHQNIKDALKTLNKFAGLTEDDILAMPDDLGEILNFGKIYLTFKDGKIVYHFINEDGNEDQGEGGAIDLTHIRKGWKEKYPDKNIRPIRKFPKEKEFDIKIPEHLNAIKSEVFEIIKQDVILRKYRKNYTVDHGTPVHHRGSLFRKLLKDEYLPDTSRSFLEYFGITLRTIEIFKRFPDITEDSFSLMRIGRILTFLSEVTSGIIIGSLNFFSAFFEFVKSIHDIIHYAKSSDRFRTIRLIEASLRLTLSLIAMPLCMLFVFATIFEIQSVLQLSLIFPKLLISLIKSFALPYYLIALSIPMLFIFITTMAVNAYIYDIVKGEYDEALEQHEAAVNALQIECERLQNDYQNPESVAALPHKLAELAKLKHELKNKKHAFLDAQRDLAFSVIEVFAYMLIGTGACLAFAMVLNPVIAPVAISLALGVTATGVAISTAVKTFQMIDEYCFDHQITSWIREKFVNTVDWLQEKAFPAIKNWIMNETPALPTEIFNDSTAAIRTGMGNTEPKSFDAGNNAPVDHSIEEQDQDSVFCLNFKSFFFSAATQPIKPANQTNSITSPSYTNNSPDEV